MSTSPFALYIVFCVVSINVFQIFANQRSRNTGCQQRRNNCNGNRMRGKNKTELEEDSEDDGMSIITIVCLVVGVTVVAIGILVTICYWIRTKHNTNRSAPPATSTFDNKKTKPVDDETVCIRPLPQETLPMSPHTVHTYEEVGPAYTSLQPTGDGDISTPNTHVVNSNSDAGLRVDSLSIETSLTNVDGYDELRLK